MRKTKFVSFYIFSSFFVVCSTMGLSKLPDPEDPEELLLPPAIEGSTIEKAFSANKIEKGTKRGQHNNIKPATGPSRLLLNAINNC